MLCIGDPPRAPAASAGSPPAGARRPRRQRRARRWASETSAASALVAAGQVADPTARAHERLRAVRVDLLGAHDDRAARRLADRRRGARAAAGRAVTQARPLTRSVWSRPGIRKISPAWPVATTFVSVSRRLLPVASGIARWSSSSTVTKPGGPPRGVTSQRPSASCAGDEHERRERDQAARHLVEWSSCLRTARSSGAS